VPLQTRVPDAKNLFSEVGHKPRATFALKGNSELPASLPQQFDRTQQGARPHYADATNLDTVAAGPDRMKFFQRPAVAALSSLPTTLVLDKNPPPVLDGTSAGAAAAGSGTGAAATQGTSGRTRRRGKHLRSTAEGDAISAPAQAAVPGMVSVGVQSMYRDGEAQTDSYTPDFVLRAGSDPEVLHLAHMTAGGRVGSRLPAGIAEVEYIEEVRERRAVEAALPPLTDEASFEHRKRLMEELELRAWTWHEAEVDAEGERRVQAVLDAVHEREAAREWVSEQRAESVRQRVEADKDRALTTIQKKRIKTLRKLSKARAAHEEHVDAITGMGGAGAGGAASGGAHNRGRRSQRDIIGEYANYSSKLYAPVAHSGHGTISGGMDEGIQHRVEAHVGDTSSFAALSAVEATLRPSTLLARTKPPSAPAAKSAAQRADAVVDRDLARVHTMLRTAKSQAAGTKLAPATAMGSTAPTAGGRLNLPLPASSLEREDVPAWRQPKEKIARPSTPTFDEEDEDAASAQTDNAVLLLQKLLRGRAVQNMMFEGKERRLELIEEMRQDLLDDEQVAEVSRQEQERQAAAAVRVAQEAAVDTAAGEVASAALDFFSKELVRQGEATRVAAVVAHAEDTRRRREVEEGGQRQAQEAVQAKADDVYRQVRAVHADTARGLVASTLAAAVSSAASSIAQAAVRAERGSGAAAGGTGSNAAVVKSLVGSFVLPEAQRAAQESKHGSEETNGSAGRAAAAAAFAMLPCKPLAMGTEKK